MIEGYRVSHKNIFWNFYGICFVLRGKCKATFLTNHLYSMKVLLDIKDDKAHHLLEVLKGLSYVKTKMISDEKALLMEELKEAFEQVRMHKQGKIKLKSAQDLLNEL